MITTNDSDLLTHLKLLLSGEHKIDEQADIFNLFPSIIYILDLRKKKIKSFNQKRFSQTLGYSIHDIDNWQDAMMQLTFKDDHATVLSELKKFEALSGTENHCYHCRLNHKE